MIWFYHMTPHSLTKETPFWIFYVSDAMLLVKINMLTWQREHFDEINNQVEFENLADIVEEVKEMTQI